MVTVNETPEVPVPQTVVTVINPLVAPAGTVQTIRVDLLLVTTAGIPSNSTALFAGTTLNPVPMIVTVVPIALLRGENEVMEGGEGITVNEVSDTSAPLEFVTEIGPVVAPAGTLVTIVVSVLLTTTAAVPLNVTALFAGVVSKEIPVIVTEVPTGPMMGSKEVIEVTGGTKLTRRSGYLEPLS